MITLVAAVIGLVGTVAAGNAFAEWLKRRSLPETIKGELAEWSELPDGEAKARLLARIERRVEGLGVDSPSRWRRGLLVFFPPVVGYLLVLFAITVINGGYYFQRGVDGILRWYNPDGHSISFQSFVMAMFFSYALVVIFSPLSDKSIRWGIDKLFGLFSRRPKSPEQVDTFPATRASFAGAGGAGSVLSAPPSCSGM